MLVNKEFRERFGTEKSRQVYQLSLISPDKDGQEEIAVEYIEGYPGEVGLLYAQKLLFRWANSLLMDTDYKDKVWEKYLLRTNGKGARLAVCKRNDGRVMVACLRYIA